MALFAIFTPVAIGASPAPANATFEERRDWLFEQFTGQKLRGRDMTSPELMEEAKTLLIERGQNYFRIAMEPPFAILFGLSDWRMPEVIKVVAHGAGAPIGGVTMERTPGGKRIRLSSKVRPTAT